MHLKTCGDLVSGFAVSPAGSSHLYSTACRLVFSSVALALIAMGVLFCFLFLISYFSNGSIFS